MTHSAILAMLQSYSCKSDQDCINALRQIMQNIALLALYRQDFFNHAAFYDGTALRILYGLERGSEDMDFSLLEPAENFSLVTYANGIITEFASFGLQAEFSEKIKIVQSNIQSAFLKSNTQAQLLSIGLNAALVKSINIHSQLKIKIEIDIQPPPDFETEIKYVYEPIPFAVRSYTLPSLLAGKLHAVLFRPWKSRIKGRDWFDLAWYAGRYPQYHLKHLENRARQSGNYLDEKLLTHQQVLCWLKNTLEKLDIELAKQDIRPFLHDPRELDIWSKEFFEDVFKRLIAV